MERKTRVWLGLGTAVLVGGGPAGRALPVAAPATPRDAVSSPDAGEVGNGLAHGQIWLAQGAPLEGGEGGEGEGGEGGGQILGTITEFRLASTDPNAFRYDASRQVAAYGDARSRALCCSPCRRARRCRRRSRRSSPPRRRKRSPPPAQRGSARGRHTCKPRHSCSTPARSTARAVPSRASIPGRSTQRSSTTSRAIAAAASSTTPRSRSTGERSSRLNQAADPTDVTTGWHAIEFLLWGEDRSAAGPGARPVHRLSAGRRQQRPPARISEDRHRASGERPVDAGRSLGARTPTTIAARSWRWTSATPSAARSTAWRCSPDTRWR